MTSEAMWRLVDAQQSVEAERLTTTVTLDSAGHRYAVAVTGPLGMSVCDIIDAARAVAGHIIRVCGGDVSAVGGKLPGPDDLPPPGAKLS